MPAPTNISRATATAISSLPYSTTQDLDFGGTTYDVWYKYTATVDGTVGLFVFGDLAGFDAEVIVYDSLTATDAYLNLSSNFGPTLYANRPIYFPITSGTTYYFWVFKRGGGYINPAVVSISMELAPSSMIQAGDFLANLEVDNDYEFPLSIMRGDRDNTMRKYIQMATPGPDNTVRGSSGLPHGETGAILNNGTFVYCDEQFSNAKIYDKTGALIIALTFADVVTVSVSRSRQTFFFYLYDGSQTLYEYSGLGLLLNTWVMSGLVGGPSSEGGFCVDGSAAIFYYNQGGLSNVKRYDLVNLIQLTDLASDTVGWRVTDLLYLEDDTILSCWHQDTGPDPVQAQVVRYDTSGSVLNTYNFGDFWRSGFNPPRIGFALDSPTSFWIALKPYPGAIANQGYQTSQLRNIRLSDGVELSRRYHVNYLVGQYLGDSTATPESIMGSEKSYAVLVMPVASASPADSDLNGPGALVGPNGIARTMSVLRLRRAPHTADEQQQIFYSKFQLDIEAGVGLVTGQGIAPELFLRWSNDGGFTWSDPRTLTVGPMGQYRHRCMAFQLGMARDRVFEVSQSDPVKTVWLQAFLDLAAGTW